jgi:hypothetical protein
VPDPDGPGRPAELASAVGKRPAALGPAGPIAELTSSWALARATLRAAEAGAVGRAAGGAAAGEAGSGGGAGGRSSPGLLRSDDVLSELLLFEGRSLVDRIGARRLAPLAELTPKARARMEETAFAYLREGGNAAAMARALDLHPQTVRYRLTRLRDLLGDQLDDPDARFELELALRAQSERLRALPPT